MGNRTVIIDLDRLYGGIWKFVFVLVLTISVLAGLAWIVRSLF